MATLDDLIALETCPRCGSEAEPYPAVQSWASYVKDLECPNCGWVTVAWDMETGELSYFVSMDKEVMWWLKENGVETEQVQ